MTVKDLKLMLEALPDEFAVRIEAKSDVPVLIRSVALETGSLVLREHMLSIGRVVDTVTAFDGSEYIIEVKQVKYPTLLKMPNPVHGQLRASVRKLDNDGAA